MYNIFDDDATLTLFYYNSTCSNSEHTCWGKNVTKDQSVVGEIHILKSEKVQMQVYKYAPLSVNTNRTNLTLFRPSFKGSFNK